MNAGQIDGCAGVTVVPFHRKPSPNVDWKARNAFRPAPASRTNARIASYLFFIGLTLSSLLALSMSYGWIALFLSGQVFSSGSWLYKSLIRKIRRDAHSASAQSAESIEGAIDEL